MYDFDKSIERRGSSSTKWDMNQERFGREDVLPMWVADMDFPCPPPVVEALQERMRHPVYGYTFPAASVYQAIVDWCERRYGWTVEREWIVFTGGVVDALYTAVEAFSTMGDQVIIQSPVYHPFFSAVRQSGRHVLNNQLLLTDQGYAWDWDALEHQLASSRIPLIILCSPHNPVGRRWAPEELMRLTELCLAHDCLVISDEIHCDLLLWGHRHTATASLSQPGAQHTITLMAASKTFNLAGLATSFVIISDQRTRETFCRHRAGRSQGNLWGYIALEAAFRYGEDYLTALIRYVEQNMQFFQTSLQERLPGLRMRQPDATYLAWVDMRSLGMAPLELQQFMRQSARLALNDGYMFGPGGEGFQRFNLGCPRSQVEEAVDRLAAAVGQL